MAHTVSYTAESDGIGIQTAKAVMDAVLTWADEDSSHHFDGVAYDNVNNGMRLSLRVTEVTEIDTSLSELNGAVASLNTSEGASFPEPSETADIRPE